MPPSASLDLLDCDIYLFLSSAPVAWHFRLLQLQLLLLLMESCITVWWDCSTYDTAAENLLSDQIHSASSNKWASTPHRRNACLRHYSIRTCVHIWSWPLTSDNENRFSNAHSHDVYLCQVSLKLLNQVHVTENMPTNGRTDGRTSNPKTYCLRHGFFEVWFSFTSCVRLVIPSLPTGKHSRLLRSDSDSSNDDDDSQSTTMTPTAAVADAAAVDVDYSQVCCQNK